MNKTLFIFLWLLFLLFFILKWLTKLIDACSVDRIEVSLVQINDKNDVIPETSQPMGGRHCNDERKYVVDEGVEGFIHEGSPRQMGNRL